MNNFGKYLTPKEAMEATTPKQPLAHYKKMASKKPRKCEACGVENEWLFGECGLCFSCTVGESNASEDYEIDNPHVPRI